MNIEEVVVEQVIERVRRTLYLSYYQSYGGAMSYQTGGCYDLARFISGYLSKFKIEHEFCVLCGYEEDDKTGLIEGTHFFIKIGDKYYDSLNFGVETTDQIFYQFEDVDLYDKFVSTYKIDRFVELSGHNDFEDSVNEIEVLLAGDYSEANVERLAVLLAIENNKNEDFFQHCFHLPDMNGYEAAYKLDPSIKNYCQTAIINALDNKIEVSYLKATQKKDKRVF